MPEWAELLVLATAALVAAGAALDFVRDGMRQRRDLLLLGRLGARPGARRARGRPDPAEEVPKAPSLAARRLRAAGLSLGPLTFAAGSALFALLVFWALQTALPKVPLAAFGGAALAAYLPWNGVAALGRLRARRFEMRLADALGFMVGTLEAGENPTQAFASVAEASTGAIRREFAEVAHRLALGMSIRRALRRIVEGYDSEGVKMFAQSLVAKWEVGGDLVPLLESVSRIVRERIQVRLRLQSHLAGARVAVVAVALLPYLVIPFYVWKMPDMLNRLLDHPLGPTLIVAVTLLQLVSWLWLGRILRIEL